MVFGHLLAASLILVPSISASLLPRQQNTTLDSCPGYKASNVKTTGNGMTASLTLAGTACNVYGTDLDELTLTVEYQSGKSQHYFRSFLSTETNVSDQTNACTSKFRILPMRSTKSLTLCSSVHLAVGAVAMLLTLSSSTRKILSASLSSDERAARFSSTLLQHKSCLRTNI